MNDHHDMLHVLLSSIFPVALSESSYGYAAPPFVMEPFYITTGLQNLLADSKAELRYEQFFEFDRISYTVRACLIILEKYYHMHFDHMLPFLFSLKHEGTNMEGFYKTTSLLDFLEVKVKGTPPEITQKRLDHLLKNISDSDLWLEVFSPDIFYFEGIYLAYMSDVTEVETLSRLRKLLLTSDSFSDYDTAKVVANLTRVYLSMFDIEVGIFTVDYPFEKLMLKRYNINYSIIQEELHDLITQEGQHIYTRACRENRIQILANLDQLESPTAIDRKFLDRGFKSLMIVPLRDHKRKVIGIMELASTQPYDFTQVKRLKLKEILPLYDVAMEDSRNAVDNSIQKVIQEQFTNIHPSVFWKFSQTAFDYINSRQGGEDTGQISTVQFNDVFPIFGQIDINSSTAIRNLAVKSDLDRNLYLVADILNLAYDHTRFFIKKN
ncbi:MAG: GAF domain-containing protein [Saprospiraceae bacterium]|nr:GAF domain-containing protein [Saprospiraceae bacterium]